MKQKQYMDTLKRIKDLVYEVNSLTQHVYDSDYAASRYGKELEEKKEELDSLKSELESALTVDSEVFNSAFMQSYGKLDETTYLEGFNRVIEIPINSNQGYVFRIDKDASYVGEVDVEAYVIIINEQYT